MVTPSHPVVVRVRGASGGLGSSTLAAGLARALAVTRPAVLIDLDLGGGGLDVTCGLEHLDGLRWGDLCDVRGPVDPGRLLDGLPGPLDCKVLSAGIARLGPRRTPGLPDAQGVRDVVGSLARAGRLLVIDQPRGRQVCPVDTTADVILVGTRTRQLADLDAALAATRVSPAVPAAAADGRLVIVTVGPQAPPHLSEAISDHTGVPVIGHLTRSRPVERALERGEWPAGREVLDVASELVRRLPELRVAA